MRRSQAGIPARLKARSDGDDCVYELRHQQSHHGWQVSAQQLILLRPARGGSDAGWQQSRHNSDSGALRRSLRTNLILMGVTITGSSRLFLMQLTHRAPAATVDSMFALRFEQNNNHPASFRSQFAYRGEPNVADNARRAL